MKNRLRVLKGSFPKPGRLIAGRLVLALVLTGFGGTARAETPQPELAARARAVVQKHCASCHGPKGEYAMVMNYVLDREELIRRKKIRPNQDARRSKIYARMARGQMPPAYVKLRPTPEEVDLVKKWIESGAADWKPQAD